MTTIFAQMPAVVRMRLSALRTFVELPIVPTAGYTSVELQRLEVDGGTGFAVLLTRSETGIVDVYHDDTLPIDNAWTAAEPALCNVTVGQIEPRSLSGTGGDGAAVLDDEGDLISAQLSFEDWKGCRIEAGVTASRLQGAPHGSIFVPCPRTDEMNQLWFLLTEEFWLMARASTVASVKIDGVEQALRTLPVPVGGRRRYLARYGGGISMIGLNPVGVAETSWSAGREQVGGVVAVDASTEAVVASIETDGSFRPAIVEFRSKSAGTELRLVFSPPLLAEPDGEDQEGELSFEMGDGPVGSAHYQFYGSTGLFELTDVDQRWRPPLQQPTLLGLELVRRWKRRNSLSWSGRDRALGTEVGWHVDN